MSHCKRNRKDKTQEEGYVVLAFSILVNFLGF